MTGLKEGTTIGVISSIATAVILALGTLVWEELSSGGIVSALGGIPKDEMTRIPNGAVLIVDNPEACPENIGWHYFGDATGKFILGASNERESTYKYREPGGAPEIKLSEDHLPNHQHNFDDIYLAQRPDWAPEGVRTVDVPDRVGIDGKIDQNNNGFVMSRITAGISSRSDEKSEISHTNFPPFIPLYFCKYSRDTEF